VSTTPKNHASLALMTLGRNVSLMSMTPESDAFAVLEYFTVVNNTAEKLLACVMTLAQASFTGVNDTAKF
jgi:hypothetical protein